MRNILSFIQNRQGRWQRLVGLTAVALGLVLLCQPLSQASDQRIWYNSGSSIRPGVSDVDMFGKRLSSDRVSRTQADADLKPGSGPVVPDRLRIPALQIDTTVEQVGLHNGNMDVPNNIWNAGWLKSSPRPGDVGNAVIDGHKDSINSGAIFLDLGKLKVGDRIYVSDQGGYELTFEVTEMQSFALSEAPLDRIFGASSDKHLNLITCDGTFLTDRLTYDKRLVVFTKLV